MYTRPYIGQVMITALALAVPWPKRTVAEFPHTPDPLSSLKEHKCKKRVLNPDGPAAFYFHPVKDHLIWTT
jgi:hypothetical protein